MTTSATIPAWFEETAQKIVAALAECHRNYLVAAQLYVEAITKDLAFAEQMRVSLPMMTGNFWRSLEKVGRGQLHHRFIGDAVPWRQMVQRLPVSEQTKAIEGQLELLVGESDCLLVRLENITQDQAAQIFAKDHIRSLAEQRAWVEDRALKRRMVGKAELPKIDVDRKRGRCVIGDIVLTRAELLDLLRRMDG